MSRKVATLVYSRKAGSLLRKSLLAYMAERANDDGTGIYCSKQRMANEIEASRGAVISNIRALVAEGVLREDGKRKHSRGWTMEYSIMLSAIMKMPKSIEDDPFKIEHVGENPPVQQDDMSSESTPRRSGGLRQDVQEDDTNRPETVPKPSTLLSDLVKAIWGMAPPTSRKRSSTKKLESALKVQVKHQTSDQLLQAWINYLRDPDTQRDDFKYVPGVDRWFRDQRYEAWISDKPQRQLSEFTEKIDILFDMLAKTGEWHGDNQGFPIHPLSPNADYDEALYERHGVKR